MINTIVDIDEIEFEYIEDTDLYESIKERGVAIPVKVNKLDNSYKCIDGNKRLSACKKLCATNEKYRRIPIMIMNDYSKAGSAFWGNTQNKH